MNKREKEIQQVHLNNEKAVLKKLEANYKDAIGEINSKIEILLARQDADMQHVIYQVEYQKALKTQVQAILETLQANEFETLSDYLTKSYEDGFIGTMYNLQGQGIPLVFPIDQEQVVAAIQHETKLSENLYTALGKDVVDLRKKIAGEISRGISSGQMYNEIARNIAGWAMIPKNNAMRIARTEAHRIQCKASMNACEKAKSKGADVVKQWDSSLDKRTRDSHVRVDGEIRELHEKFSNGLMYPGDPSGGPGEVINCRCALLQRAKWALGEQELATLKERAEYFGLDKNDSFEDFKKKYLKAAKSEIEVGKKDFVEITDAIDFAYGDYTNDDYNKWWDAYEEHNKKVQLTKDDLEIIESYTEGGFVGFNGVSRGNIDDLLKKGYTAEDVERIQKKADALESILSKYDLDSNIVTHRFERDVSWLTGAGNDVADLEKLVGSEYTAKGFTSSGMLPNRFRFTGGKKDAVHFEIVTPKGTNGAFLSMSKKGENEFLYNRNTRFRILDGGERVVKEGKFNLKTMKMEEVEITERFLKVQVITDEVEDVVKDIKKVTKKPLFTPAKTVKEAEEFVSQFVDSNVWGGTGISYKGISAESANAVNETLNKLFSTYKIDKLGGVYVAKGNTKLGKMIESATAAYSPVRQSLLLNNTALKKLDDVVKSKEEELRLIALYKENPANVVIKTKRAEDVIKASLVSGRATVPDDIADVITHEMGHAIEKAVRKAPNYEAIKGNMSKYADKISGYATINEGEYIAESFASYNKGENLIDPELKKVFEGMKK